MTLFGQVASLREFLSTTPAQITIWLAVLAILVAAGTYIVQRLRASIDEDRSDPNELLSDFREMYQRGEISESEYRTIKSQLGGRLQEKLRDREREG